MVLARRVHVPLHSVHEQAIELVALRFTVQDPATGISAQGAPSEESLTCR